MKYKYIDKENGIRVVLNIVPLPNNNIMVEYDNIFIPDNHRGHYNTNFLGHSKCKICSVNFPEIYVHEDNIINFYINGEVTSFDLGSDYYNSASTKECICKEVSIKYLDSIKLLFKPILTISNNLEIL